MTFSSDEWKLIKSLESQVKDLMQEVAKHNPDYRINGEGPTIGELLRRRRQAEVFGVEK